MSHCCQISNLASILFHGKENTCLCFLAFFLMNRNKNQTWTITVNVAASAPNHVITLSHTEQTKIYRGECVQLPVFLAQRKFPEQDMHFNVFQRTISHNLVKTFIFSDPVGNLFGELDSQMDFVKEKLFKIDTCCRKQILNLSRVFLVVVTAVNAFYKC